MYQLPFITQSNLYHGQQFLIPILLDMLAEALGSVEFGHPDILQKRPFGFMTRNAHEIDCRKSLKIEIGGK